MIKDELNHTINHLKVVNSELRRKAVLTQYELEQLDNAYHYYKKAQRKLIEMTAPTLEI